MPVLLSPGIMGPLVSAAGNMLGGWVASLLIGDTSYPKGGGIEGLTSSDPGKSGVLPAVQIDSTKTLQYFKDAAKEQTANYSKGLEFYGEQTQKAMTALSVGVLAANDKLSKLDYAGDKATDRYLQMVGLNARSPSYTSPDEVSALGAPYNDVTQLMREAEKIQDKDKRAEAKTNIVNQVSSLNYTQYHLINAQQTAALQQLAYSFPTMDQAKMEQERYLSNPAKYHSQISDLLDYNSMYMNESAGLKKENFVGKDGRGSNPYYEPMETTLTKTIYQQAVEKYNKQEAAIKANYAAQMADFSTRSSTALNNYEKNYQADADYFAFDPTEQQATLDNNNPALAEARKRLVEGKTDIAKPTAESLPNTPGYQFSLAQGQAAVQAQAAMGGMLSSGNTLAAMDKYTQGLAQQVYGQEMGFYLQGADINSKIESSASDIAVNQYNSYMQNLSNVMGQGNQATGQIASNIADLGSGLASLFQSFGGAGMQTYQGIGDALAQSLYHQGDTFNSNQLANMEAQNNMIKTSAGIQSQSAMQGGYLQLANNKFQAEQSYLGGRAAGMGGGGQSSSQSYAGPYGGWPVYDSATSRWTTG